MTRQSTRPVRHLSLTPTNRMATDLYHMAIKGKIELNPPYQRASVWTADQRLDLMHSWLSGYPTGTLIFNDRMRRTGGDGFTVCYAVIDGKQRLETAIAWFSGELAIPASWLPAGEIETDGVDQGDGPYVRSHDLTENGALRIENLMGMPVVTATVGSLAAEAHIYRRVNTGGTAHTDADIARAAEVENS